MNLIDELKSLDINDVGRWPFVFRAAVIAAVFVAISAGGIWFTIVKDRAPMLDRAIALEDELKMTFESKADKAANYDEYDEQLKKIRSSFGAMLEQLPSDTEIPELIVDISQTGLAAGLQEKLFRPEAEIPRDFYAEKPIKIRLSGGFHEIANFISGIAALPRIVTLHNIDITRENGDTFDELSIEVTAQTYRYLEEAQ